jgi:RNA polymerase sigma factor (sigma-70 family)
MRHSTTIDVEANDVPCGWVEYVEVNKVKYKWEEKKGLDPNAVLGIERLIIKLAMPFLPIALALGYDLKDLLQAGYIGALLSCRTYLPARKAKFTTWAVYKILEEIRHLCKHPFTKSLDEIGPESEPADPADFECNADPAVEKTTQILSKLPMEDREILEQYFGLGKNKKRSLKEMARERGCSASTMNTRINEILCKIRRFYV